MSDPKDNDADNLPEVQKAEIIGPTEESKSEEESGPESFQLIKVEAQFSGPLPPPSILSATMTSFLVQRIVSSRWQKSNQNTGDHWRQTSSNLTLEKHRAGNGSASS